MFLTDVPLRKFLSQFEFIASANDWSDSAKTVALAACLRGRARSVLDGIVEIGYRSGQGHFCQVKTIEW